MKSMKQIFEQGKQMARDGIAQNIRQAPHHHKEERICWQAGFLVEEEAMKAEKIAEEKAKAEAPPAVKHVGPAPVEKKPIEKIAAKKKPSMKSKDEQKDSVLS